MLLEDALGPSLDKDAPRGRATLVSETLRGDDLDDITIRREAETLIREEDKPGRIQKHAFIILKHVLARVLKLPRLFLTFVAEESPRTVGKALGRFV